MLLLWSCVCINSLLMRLYLFSRGLARTQVPATRNCTVELFTFGIIAGVSPSAVQCKSLALEEAPSRSGLLPRQVSMNCLVRMGSATHQTLHCVWFLTLAWCAINCLASNWEIYRAPGSLKNHTQCKVRSGKCYKKSSSFSGVWS